MQYSSGGQAGWQQVNDLKRGRDDESNHIGPEKRPNHGGGQREDPPADCVLKLLVANNLTGHLIGKGGTVLAKIQDESTARIKVSLQGEVVPRTGERVVQIFGATIAAVFRAMQLVSNQLAESAVRARPFLRVWPPERGGAIDTTVDRNPFPRASTIETLEERAASQVSLE